MSTHDPHTPAEGTEPVADVTREAPTPAAGTSPVETTAVEETALDEPAAAPAPTEPDERRSPRVGTVVWGLVLAVLGVGVLAWAAGREIDLDVAAIVLVAGAGVALLVGSLVSGMRRRS